MSFTDDDTLQIMLKVAALLFFIWPKSGTSRDSSAVDSAHEARIWYSKAYDFTMSKLKPESFLFLLSIGTLKSIEPFELLRNCLVESIAANSADPNCFEKLASPAPETVVWLASVLASDS